LERLSDQVPFEPADAGEQEPEDAYEQHEQNTYGIQHRHRVHCAQPERSERKGQRNSCRHDPANHGGPPAKNRPIHDTEDIGAVLVRHNPARNSRRGKGGVFTHFDDTVATVGIGSGADDFEYNDNDRDRSACSVEPGTGDQSVRVTDGAGDGFDAGVATTARQPLARNLVRRAEVRLTPIAEALSKPPVMATGCAPSNS